jgi:hypothetical protein
VAQHHKNPIDLVSVGSERDKDRRLREGTVAVYSRTRDVEGKREIKTHEVERFVSEFGERADLSLIFRETAHEISRISRAVRCFLEKSVKENIKIYRSFLDMCPSYESENRVFRLEIRTDEDVRVDCQMFDEFVRQAGRRSKELLLSKQRYHFTSNRSPGHGRQ